MAARHSFSNDSRIVKMPLPKSVLLKDYLIDDLSSCSSNGFRSYPRRQCCTKVRYLIEIDLNKHINLPLKQKRFLKSKSKLKQKSKSKSALVLHKASAAVVNVFKHFRFSGSGKPTKNANFLPKNLSRKLSKRGFWKRTTDRHNRELKRLNSFDESVKQKRSCLPPLSKVSTAVTTTVAEANADTSNSNSSASSESYFTATSGSSTAGSSFKINVAQINVEESEQHATEKKNAANGMKVSATSAIATATATATNDSANENAKKGQESEKKEQFSPVSVMEFPCDSDNDDEDEVTSPFLHMPKFQRLKSLAKVTRVRLEDRIKLSESRTCDLLLHEDQSSKQPEKKAIALLQQLKATMSSRNHQFESTMTRNVLLGFFVEGIAEGNVTNFALLQEAKDWINGQAREMTYIRDMGKGKVNWSKYDDQMEKEDICLELEYHIFTSLVEEMLLEFHL